jgi:hypothetical protein
MDTGREQAKRVVVRNGKKDTTTSPLCWTVGANTVVRPFRLFPSHMDGKNMDGKRLKFFKKNIDLL